MKNAERAAVEAVPMARRPAPLREEAAARDAQQGDRDPPADWRAGGRAPRSQVRFIATFFIFFRQIAYRGLGAARCL